jgi:endonuclease YncB( thermonuclease family)
MGQVLGAVTRAAPWAALFVLALAVAPSGAQVMLGTPKAVDGDTITVAGDRIRLFGIDAPEAHQTCSRGGAEWPCGEAATEFLASQLGRGQLQCKPRDIDRYDRTVAICLVGDVDLSRAMVQSGFAVALPDFSSAYVAEERRAHASRLGIWAGTFDQPADYRRHHPGESAPARVTHAMRRSQIRTTHIPTVAYYPSCRAAWAAGAAPIYRGEPGYRVQLDGDRDGIACEPFRQR